MAKYLLHCEVISAAGSQTFIVEAASEEEALTKHRAGDSDLFSEEVEVMSLSKHPDIELYDGSGEES